MKRPNILMIMGDQHPVLMNGCYGDGVARTPALDGLAARGVTFDAAYCPSPLCAPSRAAMMTGRHVHKIEVWDNASPLRSDWPTFAHSLASGGYRTILSGKMHFVGPDQFHGFEERWTQDIYPAVFSWTNASREGVYVPEPGKGQSRHRVFDSGIGRSEDMDYDEEVLFRTLYGMRQLGRDDDERPFFLCASFTSPHYPFYAPKEYWDRFSDEDIKLPELPENFMESDPEYIKWFRDYAHLNEPIPDEVIRRAKHAIYGRIAMLDDYIARIIDTLKQEGFYENTIIIYTSDHGDMMGEHGLWFKCTAYDGSSRVPLIITGEGIPAHRVDTPVSLLDIGPTLCALAGVEPVYPFEDGRDISGLVYGTSTEPGEAIVEYHGDGTWKGWRMLRRGDLKLVYANGCRPVLYDMKNDPGEWHDLAGLPEYADLVKDMTNRILADWDPDESDEKNWQSQERRLAILKAIKNSKIKLDWKRPSPPVPPAKRKRQ